MNKSQRIWLDVNNPNTDKHIKIRLEQDIDFLELLSLDIKTKDIYRNFNSNYGVLVGRVIANNGIGIPNAKISIFIPLSEEDEDDDEIRSIYPYKTPRDKNNNGKRYNLLPRVSEYDPESFSYKPKQPFGSFPIKPEIVTNRTFLNIYKKYYKFSTVTNNTGDYMIFGAPVGLQTIHMSVDITDIGKYSMTPPVMVTELGYSPNLFTDNNTRVKENNDLDDLPHIETQEIDVDIKPFWGDKENFEIGISRQDFRIRAELVNTFTVFGSCFTDGNKSTWGSQWKGNIDDLYRMYSDTSIIDDEDSEQTTTVDYNTSIVSKRTGKINEQIFYYPSNITDTYINNLLSIDDEVYNGEDMLLLDSSEYTSIKRNGDFVFILACNRNKVIIDETGNEVPVFNDYEGGVFTKFRGFMTFEMSETELPIEIDRFYPNITLNPVRGKLKIPQKSEEGNSFCLYDRNEITRSAISMSITDDSKKNADIITSNWRKQHKTFEGGSFYTVSRFHPTVKNHYLDDEDSSIIPDPNSQFIVGVGDSETPQDFLKYTNGSVDKKSDYVNDLSTRHPGDPWLTVGLIGSRGLNFEETDFINNAVQSLDYPGGAVNYEVFGANWLNFSLYFPQISHIDFGQLGAEFKNTISNTYFTKEFRLGPYGYSTIFPPQYNYIFYIPSTEYSPNLNMFNKNNKFISANILDLTKFLRSDIHWTDFIKVERKDIETIYNALKKGDIKKGFKRTDGLQGLLESDFKNGVSECPIDGGRMNGIPTNLVDRDTYFYLGHNEANCIYYLKELGLF